MDFETTNTQSTVENTEVNTCVEQAIVPDTCENAREAVQTVNPRGVRAPLSELTAQIAAINQAASRLVKTNGEKEAANTDENDPTPYAEDYPSQEASLASKKRLLSRVTNTIQFYEMDL